MDRRHTDPAKIRSSSTESTTSSITEYVNQVFEASELELSKVVSVGVTNDTQNVKNPINSSDVEDSTRTQTPLQNFSDPSTSETITDGPLSIFNVRKMYVASLVVLLFAVCMGMTATYTATATLDMKKPRSTIRPNDDQVTWIGSLVAIGALIGGSAGGFFTSFLGRKGTLIINTLPFVTGWLLIAYAPSIGYIYIGRVITGFCTGIVSVATPMYLIEISTPEVRGLLGSSFQLFVVIGVLFVDLLGSAMTWNYLAISGAITSLVAAALMIFMPESPRWLLTKKRRVEAKKGILFLQGKGFDSEAELFKMEEDIKSQPKGAFSVLEFRAPTAYKPFILSILLMFFQQFSGVNAVLFYCAQIFEDAKSSMDSIQSTIIVAVVQVIATLVASLLMDKAGRRILLFTSSVCMAISLLIFGAFAFAQSRDKHVVDTFGWVPLVSLVIFIAAFSIGWGPAPWLMVAEMTSARLRSTISGVATALNWTFVFMVTKSYKAEEDAMKTYGVYWMYAGFCTCSALFVFFCLPETKGKSLEEIQERFMPRTKSITRIE